MVVAIAPIVVDAPEATPDAIAPEVADTKDMRDVEGALSDRVDWRPSGLTPAFATGTIAPAPAAEPRGV